MLRAGLAAALFVAVALGGCVGGVEPPAAEVEGAPALACPDPCAVAIDRGTRWEPAVAAHPTDASRIVAASMDQGFDGAGVRRSWPLGHVSEDGGATWTTARLPMGPEAGPGHPLATFNQADDPALLFLPDGTLLYTALVFSFASAGGVGLGMTAPSIALWRSTDGGATFPEARVLFAGSGARSAVPGPGYANHDKQWLAAGSDGTVLMAWNLNEVRTPGCPESCTRVLASASTDGGRAWSAPSVVYEGVASGAFPLVLGDGSWVVSYRETSDAAVHVAVSRDRGATWSTNATIDRTTKFPVLAKTVGPGASGERVYMAYPMTGEKDGQPDVPQTVTLRWSDDGGLTWSAPLALEESKAAGRTSPMLAATADGGAIVTYWLPRGEGDALRAELRAAFVAPDGTVMGRLALGAHEGPMDTTGDYMGLAVLPDGQSAFAVWNARQGDEHAVTGARLTVG